MSNRQLLWVAISFLAACATPSGKMSYQDYVSSYYVGAQIETVAQSMPGAPHETSSDQGLTHYTWLHNGYWVTSETKTYTARTENTGSHMKTRTKRTVQLSEPYWMGCKTKIVVNESGLVIRATEEGCPELLVEDPTSHAPAKSTSTS